MNFSIRATIRGFVAPDHRLSCSSRVWREGVQELWRRSDGVHESGAFLLGTRVNVRRSIKRFVFYDDLDPQCLATGIVIFDGAGYGPLWQLCRATGLEVIADVHTHGGQAQQSSADRRHPMVATPGHIAIILPRFARPPVSLAESGLYEYLGNHEWHDYSGAPASRFLYIGRWG